jgi:hypothetical protein
VRPQGPNPMSDAPNQLPAPTAPAFIHVRQPAEPDPEAPGGGETTLSPEARAKGDVRGVPVVLGDGAEWTLAWGTIDPGLDAYRDRLYDGMVIRGQVPADDVRAVAWSLLRANYHLTGDEAAWLVVFAPAQGVADAVMDALVGKPTDHLTYSQWVRSALAANGIDPRSVDPEILPLVLRQLVQAGRALAPEKVISSLEYAHMMRGFRGMMGGPPKPKTPSVAGGTGKAGNADQKAKAAVGGGDDTGEGPDPDAAVDQAGEQDAPQDLALDTGKA